MPLQVVNISNSKVEFANKNDDPNFILGQQLVQKDLQILKLETDNSALGKQIVDLDIRLMMGGL